MLERYGHGGDLQTAEETYGRAKEEWIDFSANMNPLGPPKVIKKIMADQWAQIAHYPDPAVRQLRQKLSETYGIPSECILVGNGAAELIDLVIRCFKFDRTALTRPSFTEYEEAILKENKAIYELPLNVENSFILDEHDVERAIEEVDCFFLGHPNNPTGQLVPFPILQQIIDSGKMLVLDEAFIDFLQVEEQMSLVQKVTQYENLIVIRSMTKFFSIPGIRLGFLAAHPSIIDRLNQYKVQWSVNYLAQLIGVSLLNETEYIEKTKPWLANERKWLKDELTSLGFHVNPSETNYLLFSTQNEQLSAQKLQVKLAQKGILIRDASLFKGLDETYCRCAVRLRQENEALIQALKEVLRSEMDLGSAW